MPDVRFYCPSDKSFVIAEFKDKHGKTWGRRIAELMEADISEETGEAGAAADAKAVSAEAVEIFERIFGDIKSEREFIEISGSREAAASGIRNRLDAARLKYRRYYAQIIELMKDRLPALSKLAGVVKDDGN